MRIALFLLLAACSGAPKAPLGDLRRETLNQRARICADHLRAAPEDHAAHTCARRAFLRQGARAALIELLEGLPEGPLKPYFLGRARLSVTPEAARALFESCRAPHCLFGQALIAERQGRVEEALGALALARALAPEDLEMRAAAARLSLKANAGAEAEGHLKALLRADLEHPEAHWLLAARALQRGDVATARVRLEVAVEGLPDAPEPLSLRAKLHRQLGDRDAALKDLRAALSRERDDPELRARTAEALLELGEASEAIDHLNVLTQSEERFEWSLLLARAHLADDAPAQALAWIDRARERRPRDRRGALLRALTLIALGRAGELEPLERRLYEGAGALGRRLVLLKALHDKGEKGAVRARLSAAKAAHPKAAAPWLFEAERAEPDEALRILLEGLRATDSAALHEALGARFEARRDFKRASKAYLRADELGHTPARGAAAARARWQAGAKEEALRRWRLLLKRHPHEERPRLEYAAALASSGQHREAADVLAPLLVLRPGEPSLYLRLGTLRLKARQPTEAAEALRAGLKLGGQATQLRPLLAVALGELGEFEEAEGLFEAALEADPTNHPLRLTFAAFQLKAGRPEKAKALYWAQWARTPHDPGVRAALRGLEGEALRWPAPWPALSQDPALAPFAARIKPGVDSTVLLDERALEVDATGVVAVRIRRAILIQSLEAAKGYEIARVSFNVDHPPQLIHAHTITPDGHRLALARQQAIDPHQRSKQYGDGRQLLLRFSGLEPGAVIDYEVRVPRPNPPLKGIWWDAYPLGNHAPTLESRYTLTLPEGAPLNVKAPGLGAPQREALEGGRRRITWRASSIPALANQRGGPAIFATSLPDWAALDRWYAALFTPRAQAGPLTLKRSAKLGGPRARREEIIAEALRFVESEIEYLGIEFGIGAYQPRPPESTLSTRKGDCKDMTALMVALLRERGIEAHPALISPGQVPLLEGFPSPSQFSHVILYVPDKRGDLFLDATAGAGTLRAIPKQLRGQTAFIIDGRGGRLLKVPEARLTQHRLEERHRFELTPTGGGRLIAELRLRGDPAGEARAALKGDPGLYQQPRALSPVSLRPLSVEVEGRADPHADLIVRGTYEDPDLVSARLDGVLEVPLDALLLTPLLRRFHSEPRQSTIHVEIQPPKGHKIDWQPHKHRLTHGPLEARLSERRRRGAAIITLELKNKGGATKRDLLAVIKGMEARLGSRRLLPGPRFDRLTFLKTIAEERRDDARLQILYAHALFERGEFEAIPAILGPVEQFEARLLLAMAHSAMDQNAATIAALRGIVDAPQARPEHALMLALLLHAEEGPLEAITALERAHARFPEHGGVRLELIRTLDAAGRAQDALDHLNAWARGQLDAPLFQLRGDLHLKLGRHRDSERDYRAALALAPHHPPTQLRLARLLAAQERRVEAIALLEALLKRAPREAEAWFTLADLRFEGGEQAAALEAIDAALEYEGGGARRDTYARAKARYLKGE